LFAHSPGGKNIFLLGIILSAVSIFLDIVFGAFDIGGLDWIVLLIVVVQMGLLGVIVHRVENELEIKFGKS